MQQAAGFVRSRCPEAGAEVDAELEEALVEHLKTGREPSISCWPFVKRRVAFQPMDRCEYSGEPTRSAHADYGATVTCKNFKRPGGCGGECFLACLAKTGADLSERWTCRVCAPAARTKGN